MKATQKLLVEMWCKSVLQTYVFTFNGWWRCPQKRLHNTPKNIRDFPKELLVTAFQNSKDFSHDCLIVRPRSRVLRDSYVAYILRLLQEVLPFKVKLRVADGREGLGSKPHNGSMLQDMVGVVASGKADLGTCHIQVTPLAAQHVDYLLPTLTTSRSLVFIPEKLHLAEDVFVETFSGELWACFLAAFVLLILCFRLSTWLHSKVQPNHEPWSWIEVILWAIAAVCQQSYSRYPKGLSCRTTFIIGYLITYLLYTGFAAGVTSLLAVQSQNLNLNLDDVLEMKLTVLTARTAQNPYLEGATFISQGLKHGRQMRRINTEIVKNNNELFRKLHSDSVVGYGYTPSFELHIQHLKQRKIMYHLSRLEHPRFQESLIIRKNFPFKHLINIWLLKMLERGLLDFGQERYVKSKRLTSYSEVAWSSASLQNVYSAVALLTFGIILSVLILFAEMAWMKKVTGTKWEEKAKLDVFQRCK